MPGFAVYLTPTPADPANAIVQTLVDTIKRERFVAGRTTSDAEAFGVLMAGYFDWDARILEAAAYALEDANFHGDSATVSELYQAHAHADDDQPYDDSMRKALFARLNEVYGPGLSRPIRLGKVSKLIGRPVHSMSCKNVANPVTRGEFARAMEILSTLSDM